MNTWQGVADALKVAIYVATFIGAMYALGALA